MTVSDPEGRAAIEITRAYLAAYRFGTQTSTSLVCGRCGIYAGAMLEVGRGTWSVLNVRGLAIAEFLSRTPTLVNYDGETAQSRTTRRTLKWTPTDVIFT